jgi:hypothetical protein
MEIASAPADDSLQSSTSNSLSQETAENDVNSKVLGRGDLARLAYR